jgi:hypothetical protein
MEVASAAISPLGFVLDLMLRRVLMRMCKRSAARGGVVSAWLARLGGWTRARSGARRSQDCYGSAKAIAVKAKVTRGRRKRNGVNPPRAALFIGGPPNLPVTVPSPVQHTSTALS